MIALSGFPGFWWACELFMYSYNSIHTGLTGVWNHWCIPRPDILQCRQHFWQCPYNPLLERRWPWSRAIYPEGDRLWLCRPAPARHCWCHHLCDTEPKCAAVVWSALHEDSEWGIPSGWRNPYNSGYRQWWSKYKKFLILCNLFTASWPM